MNGIDADEMSFSSDGRRPRPPVIPTIEMTESFHLNMVGEKRIEKMVRTTDSLFDYGAD